MKQYCVVLTFDLSPPAHKQQRVSICAHQSVSFDEEAVAVTLDCIIMSDEGQLWPSEATLGQNISHVPVADSFLLITRAVATVTRQSLSEQTEILNLREKKITVTRIYFKFKWLYFMYIDLYIYLYIYLYFIYILLSQLLLSCSIIIFCSA